MFFVFIFYILNNSIESDRKTVVRRPNFTTTNKYSEGKLKSTLNRESIIGLDHKGPSIENVTQF
jgi:hypothetical protein